MAFLDEEEALAPAETAPAPQRRRPPRAPRPERQQILIRRLIAVGAGVLLLILILLGIRGCLEARKDRAIRNYVSDVAALMGDSTAVGEDFFGLLDSPGTRGPVEFEAEIKADRGAADQLLDRARGLDTPDEMSGAQQAIELAMELRRNGLESVGNDIGIALGREDSQEAVDRIHQQMQAFLASDVVYQSIAQREIADVLEAEGLDDIEVPPGDFMSDTNEKYLELAEVQDAIGVVSGGETVTGVHGLGLVSVAIGDIALVEGTPVTVSAGRPELVVQVQNQGDSDESGVIVSADIDGTPLEGEPIATIAAGDTADVRIPITAVPTPGEPVTIEVNVQPVPGEQVEDNNTATYEVTFE